MYGYGMYLHPTGTTPTKAPVVYYEVSWTIRTEFGALDRCIRDNEEHVNIIAESLKDDSLIEGLSVQLAKTQTTPSNGHDHIVDEVPQNHDWSQCPDNPINIF